VTKRRALTDPRQIDLFAVPAPTRGPASFAGYGQQVSAAISNMLRHDLRSREEIAAALSSAMAEDVSPQMLDAYSAPARGAHNISFARAIAFVSVTDQHGMIEDAVRRLGGHILWGAEIKAAELGHIDSEIARLRQRRKQLAPEVSPITQGRKHA